MNIGPVTGLLARRSFVLGDQLAFAALSGDSNPMHIDPEAARRTVFGGTVVHGVHGLLWCLDQFLGALGGDESQTSIVSLRVGFRAPVMLGDSVWCELVSFAGGRAELRIMSQGRIATDIRLELGAPGIHPQSSGSGLIADPGTCRELGKEDIESARGETDVRVDFPEVRACFPSLARHNLLQLSVLLVTTRIVGMECPGKHSIFSAIELRFAGTPVVGDSRLKWNVSKFDDRFALTEIAVEGAGASGRLSAFLRPPPHAQPSFDEIKAWVEDREFAGQKALVIGGSRGLGEVAAKLLAAGGASVCISYRLGRTDALRVVREIQASDGEASLIELDVVAGTPPPLPFEPTHLYFFATPKITQNKTRNLSREAFDAMASQYLSGFVGLIGRLAPRGIALRVLWPSTAYLDESPASFPEYRAAKAAGEALCRELMLWNPDLQVSMPRLPRVATDQTSEISGTAAPSPVEVIRDALRMMNSSQT